jgi:hypothetical protein
VGSSIILVAPWLYAASPTKLDFSFSKKPLVFDLTANVLGPAEGFSRAGFSVHSGIGNEQETTVTWKVSFRMQFDFHAYSIRSDILTATCMMVPRSLFLEISNPDA